MGIKPEDAVKFEEDTTGNGEGAKALDNITATAHRSAQNAGLSRSGQQQVNVNGANAGPTALYVGDLTWVYFERTSFNACFNSSFWLLVDK